MERSPYTPPTSDAFQHPASADGESRRKGRVLAIIGVIFFSAPAWGIGGTLMRLNDAFEKLGREQGVDPTHLAADVSDAMISAAIGAAVGLVGVVLVLIAFFGKKNREKWFLRWVVGLALIWCLCVFPFGLSIGIPFLILFITRRAEFRPRAEGGQGSEGLSAD